MEGIETKKSRYRLNLDLNLIRTLYTQGLSSQEIADKLGCCQYSVWLRLKKLGCMRTNSESKKLAVRQGKMKIKPKVNLDLDLVKHLYVDEYLSAEVIAKQSGCGASTVLRRLAELGCVRDREQVAKLKSGPNNPLWKGGRRIAGGYIVVWARGHHRANKQGYVREHILVWEQAHNKKLPQGWEVHHLNGITTDNRPNNLLALPNQKHQLIIPKMKERIRQLEIENHQLRRALENNQMIFYMSEN